jgi:hypothetical protein
MASGDSCDNPGDFGGGLTTMDSRVAALIHGDFAIRLIKRRIKYLP